MNVLWRRLLFMLAAIARWVKVTVIGESPLTLQNAIAADLISLVQDGKCVQNGIPAPDAPVDILFNNDKLVARHQSGLPLGYQLLEYARSSGTQYLDLGYKGNGNTKVDVKFRYYAASSVKCSGRVFGSRYSYQSSAFAIGSSSGTVAAGAANQVFWCYDSQAFYVNGERFGLDVWKTIVFSATEHTIDGVSVGDDYEIVAFETPENLKLFAFDNNSSFGGGYVDVEYCKLWDNGVLVRDLVPAKNASNVVSMYDLVSGQFLPNAGTGDFIAGPAVSDPVVVYADGTPETITVNQQTIYNIPDLLSVGGIADSFDIISGLTTRNIGTLILDGVTPGKMFDSITVASNYSYSLITVSDRANNNTDPLLCTHFRNANMATTGTISSSSGRKITFRFEFATVEDANDWLKTEYDAGTPVIVIYPLESQITEQLSPNTVEITTGTNIITATTEVDPVTLTAEYKASQQPVT